MNCCSSKACVNELFDKREQFANLWFYMAHSGLVHINLEQDNDRATSPYQSLRNREHRQRWLAVEASLKTTGQTEPGMKSKNQSVFNY